MAKRIKPIGGKTKLDYPWNEWLDGSAWLLTRGEDFFCSIESFKTNIRRHAKERKIAISVLTTDNEDQLVVQPRHGR